MNIKDMAMQLGVAESTLRYWRDRYQEFIPSTGVGRRRRYPDIVLEIFKFIRDQGGRNVEDVKEALSLQFPYKDEDAAAAVQQQQHGSDLLPATRDIMPVVQEMVGNVLNSLATLADQKGRLDRLEADVRELMKPAADTEREILRELETARFLVAKIDLYLDRMLFLITH